MPHIVFDLLYLLSLNVWKADHLVQLASAFLPVDFWGNETKSVGQKV